MNNEQEDNENFDAELSEMQRKVVAIAIEATEAAIAAHERDRGAHTDPSLRVRAIATVVVHALNAYATEYHLVWTGTDWFEHQVETAIAALTANNHQLAHDITADVLDTARGDG